MEHPLEWRRKEAQLILLWTVKTGNGSALPLEIALVVASYRLG
jgi:hypothetical protein